MSEEQRREANKRLAELLGWTGIEPHTRWNDDENGYYSWQALRGTTPAGVEDVWLPDWHGSLSVAWRLFDLIPDDFTPRLVRVLQPLDGVMKYAYKAGVIHNATGDDNSVVTWEPAQSVCRAFELWTDMYPEAWAQDGAQP